MNHTKLFADPEVLTSPLKTGESRHHQGDARQTPLRQNMNSTEGEGEVTSSLRSDGEEGVTSSPQLHGPLMEDRTRTKVEKFHLPRTFVRPKLPQELLEQPYVVSRRAGVNISVISPKHSSGGLVAGKLNISVRGNEGNGQLELGRVSIDLIGIEELSWKQRVIFLSLASELVDEDHSPPQLMLDDEDRPQEISSFWRLKPSHSQIPFRMQLPHDVGPGSFDSSRARIRYVLFATILFKHDGHAFIVRTYRDVNIIPNIDIQHALLPLVEPLSAVDWTTLSNGAKEALTLKAEIQRAFWVSGSSAFIDVRISNRTDQRVRKLQLKLVQQILAYKQTIAKSDQQETGHLRGSDWQQKKTVSSSRLNVGSRWRGVMGYQDDDLICEIEIPRNLVTVPLSRYFEVKYYIQVSLGVRTSLMKSHKVKVHLPINIIDINNLDKIPNLNPYFGLSTTTASVEQSHRSTFSSLGRIRARNTFNSRNGPAFFSTPTSFRERLDALREYTPTRKSKVVFEPSPDSLRMVSKAPTIDVTIPHIIISGYRRSEDDTTGL